MSEHFHNPFYLGIYMLGTLCASYHLSYGIWNFCIRWGITVSEESQAKVQKFAFVMFICVTIMAWAALAGFLIPHGGTGVATTATA